MHPISVLFCATFQKFHYISCHLNEDVALYLLVYPTSVHLFPFRLFYLFLCPLFVVSPLSLLHLPLSICFSQAFVILLSFSVCVLDDAEWKRVTEKKDITKK